MDKLIFFITCLCLVLRWTFIESFCTTDNRGYILTYTNTSIVDPYDFRDCFGASTVNLSHNQIVTLTNVSFDFMWNVRTLDLAYNLIEELPSQVFVPLRNVQYLNISHNFLETLPLEFFSNKLYLKVVDLSYNRITHIPLHVFDQDLSSIQEVNLQHNFLTAFEPWAFAGHPIELLDLKFNNISTFTNDYNWKYKSRRIYNAASTDMRNNSLHTWHDWYLMQYKEEGSGTIESAMVELLTDVRNNPLTCDCNFHNVRKTIDSSFYKYSNNPYTSLTCIDPPELRGKRIFFDVKLNEFVCNLTDNCPTSCLCQEKPEENVFSVDCRGAKLTRVPDTVPESNINNIVLMLDNNNIDSFQNVSYLHRVTKLTMANNRLRTLPDFVMLAVAKEDDAEVDFRNNYLKEIPESTQNIKYQNAKFTGNELECTCDMLWMIDWINLAPNYVDKGALTCTFEEEVYKIIDLDEDVLNCHDIGNIILIVCVCVALAIVIALLVTAKRCPYETKVILFKIFRIHPSDKYKIDEADGLTYDMCVSFDENDYYVRQWVMRKLFKTLEENKPFYRLCTQMRNGNSGPEADSRLELIEKSRRLLIILSHNYERRRWNDYDLCHAEKLDQNDGRVMFILYDKIAIENSTKEPLASKLKERKVFTVHDKLLWSKLRYELPIKPCPEQKITKADDNDDFTPV